jgi:hypothetical protein
MTPVSCLNFAKPVVHNIQYRISTYTFVAILSKHKSCNIDNFISNSHPVSTRYCSVDDKKAKF